MVIITVRNILKSYTTNQDGDQLFDCIRRAFDRDEKVAISFENIHGLNSSFVNSAFVQLLDYYDFDYIKKHLTFRDSNKQINNLILSRFVFETNKCTA
ncbi:STAS-like domain-containing protein [Enterococcus mundtii]|uniref:STAS-like domain-containing protein n=1 Tax=Enterococcus mundtii TaxID=53346 RepID=UPI0010BF1B77|nr:STAS-like domain-containing protein [Enterococcus mundtii]QCJ57672.1 hypothetical protein DDJ96_14200 [Enterococcus mundtii]